MLDYTPSGPTSNSYASLVEANTYFATRYGSAPWLNLSDDAIKESLLITSTARLEQEKYDFYRYSQTQRLSWGRTGIVTPDGVPLPSGSIPDAIKYAEFELAFAILTGGITTSSALNSFKSISLAGVMSLVPRNIYEGNLPESVYAWLQGYLISSGGTIQLYRS